MEIKLEMYDKADSKLAFLANVCPNESNTFEYARLKALKDDLDNAIFYAKKSIEYNKRMLPSYVILGQIYTKKLDEENAMKYFEEAETQNLKAPNLYLEWGKSLIKFERFDEGKQKLLKAYEMDGENLEIIANLGLCCVERKEYEEAEPLLNKVLEKEPENKTVKQALGISAFENGDLERAFQIFRSDDEDSVNCFYIAKCYEQKEDDIKTRDYYEASLRINPKYIKAYVNYVNFLMSKNDFIEAQRKLRKALKYDENNIELLNLMFYTNYILVKDNYSEYNLKEAISIAEKTEKLGEDLFKYPEQKQELQWLLQERE
jgi:tetratricopeptide (TPR) repeat protein